MSDTRPAGRLFGVSMGKLTVLSLAGLAVGMLAGTLVVGEGGGQGTDLLLATAGTVVRAWTNGLRLLVVPLVVAQLYLAMTSGGHADRAATRPFGVLIPVVFLGLLVLTAGVTVVMASVLLTHPFFGQASLGAVASSAGTMVPSSGGLEWVDAIIPPNLFSAAANDNLLPLMLFAAGFGLAMRRAAPEARVGRRLGNATPSGAAIEPWGWPHGWRISRSSDRGFARSMPGFSRVDEVRELT